MLGTSRQDVIYVQFDLNLTKEAKWWTFPLCVSDMAYVPYSSSDELVPCSSVPHRNDVLLLPHGHHSTTDLIPYHELLAKDSQDLRKYVFTEYIWIHDLEWPYCAGNTTYISTDAQSCA